MRRGLWVRWSWRDLRQRWVLVLAIATVIGLGTGLYAGLTSTSTWRQQSNDASFAMLNVHDLRVRLSPGNTVPRGRLTAVLETLPHAGAVTGRTERLVLPTQLDASRPGHDVLVPGELVGVDVAAGPQVDGIAVHVGRGLTAADRGLDVGVLDYTFGRTNKLPATGTVRVSGGQQVRYVGQGQSPEYFILISEDTGLLTKAGFGVLFTTLETAQRLAGVPGADTGTGAEVVNDLVVTVRPGTDVAAVRDELAAAFATQLPETSLTVTTRDQIDAYRILYDDIEADQKVWNVLAVLVLAGAVFAAFNLVSRVVDAQRREIGIGMALGVSPGWLALRPVLLGVQVALLGVVTGIGVGIVVSAATASLLRGFWALPVWHTSFQYGVFARAAAVGLVLPMLAVIVPVWHAVRVPPVDAIRVTAVAGRTSRSRLLAPLRRISLPGGSIRQLPLRNLVRAPRRALFTALGISAALVALVTFTGQLDTFTRTLDGADRELRHSAPDRLTVTLSGIMPLNSPTVAAVRELPAVARVDTGLALPGTISNGDRSIDVITQVLDTRHGMWSPTIVRGDRTGGLLVADKAAADLGVEPGDTVTLRHPQRAGSGFRMVDTPMPVAGVHAFPMRPGVILDSSDAAAFNLADAANMLHILPSESAGQNQAVRALFAIPGVGSVAAVTASIDQIRDLLDRFTGFLRIAEIVVLLLALLIAFNATSIAMEERRREHATMAAFGLPTRTVVALTVVESALVGLLGTLIGLVVGFAVLTWTIESLFARTLPDIGLQATLSPSTLLVTVLLGVVAVAAAPLFAARRLARMNIPSTLRVVE